MLCAYSGFTNAWPSSTAQVTTAVLQIHIALSQATLEENVNDVETRKLSSGSANRILKSEFCKSRISGRTVMYKKTSSISPQVSHTRVPDLTIRWRVLFANAQSALRRWRREREAAALVVRCQKTGVGKKLRTASAENGVDEMPRACVLLITTYSGSVWKNSDGVFRITQ